MPIVRSTLWSFLTSFAFPFACGSDEGPPSALRGGGRVDDEGLPTPTLVCPAYAGEAYPEIAALDVAKAQPLGAIDGAFSICVCA